MARALDSGAQRDRSGPACSIRPCAGGVRSQQHGDTTRTQSLHLLVFSKIAWPRKFQFQFYTQRDFKEFVQLRAATIMATAHAHTHGCYHQV